MNSVHTMKTPTQSESSLETDIRFINNLHVDVLNANVDFNFKLIYRDFRCGWKSNIPICCMLFFSFFWRFLYLFVNYSLVKKFLSSYPADGRWRYKPCFMCFLFGRVRKLYLCNENDVSCCWFNEPKAVLLTERIEK